MNVGLVWYLFMFTSRSFPTATTNALFVSQAQSEATFHAGTWYDHSLLEFDNSCSRDHNEIYAYIKNTGTGDMAQDSKYYVYYSPTGDPNGSLGVTGELVFSQGLIPKIASNGTPEKLTYTPVKPGYYKFVAFQDSDKPVDKEKDTIIDGKPVAVSGEIYVSQP